MEQVTMMDRAASFKRVWDSVDEEVRHYINPEHMGDEMLLTVSVIVESVDPVTGNRRLTDFHLADQGERVAAPWQAKGNLIETFQQFDKNRGRE